MISTQGVGGCLTRSVMMIASSCSVHASRMIDGSIWLHQRSLHCLPDREPTSSAIADHFFGPCSKTAVRSVASSSQVHGRLVLRVCCAFSGRLVLHVCCALSSTDSSISTSGGRPPRAASRELELPMQSRRAERDSSTSAGASHHV